MSEKPAASALDRLQREPSRFSLDRAAEVLAPGLDPAEIRFRTPARLGAPAGEVAAPKPGTAKSPPEIVTPTFGLIGPGGVLARHYTALVAAEARRRSTALHQFLDLLARRFTGFFITAGAKHRPTRNPAPAERVLAAVAGLGTPNLAPRLATPMDALLFHAGTLAARSRSADRLRGMISEEIGGAVEIVEFTGGWIRLPITEQTRIGLGGRHAGLGVDAALGAEAWDPAARFIIRLGPLSLQRFEALLPGAPLHGRLVELTRLHVGLEQDFAFNPVLAAAAVPSAQMGPRGARLGWTSWLGTPKPRTRDAAEAILAPKAPIPGEAA